MPFSHRPEVFEADELARMTIAYNNAMAELQAKDVLFEPEDLAEVIIALRREMNTAELARSAVERIAGFAQNKGLG